MLARWIDDRKLNDLQVAMREPGYFSFLSQNPVIDAAGLVTEGIVFHRGGKEHTSTTELLAQWQPDLIVTSPPGWPDKDLEDFLPLYHTVPVRSLLIHRRVLIDRYAGLRDAWLEREAFWPGDQEPLRGPFEVDFEGRRLPAGWLSGGSLRGTVGRPTAATYQGRRVNDNYAHTAGHDTWGILSSPPLLLDFDALAFRFAGTARLATRARLLVDGQEVLSAPGTGRPEMVDVEWPLATWRGKVGVLQFVDETPRAEHVLADRVRTVQYERMTLLEDFESGAYSSTLWERTFGAAPTPLSDVAAYHGLAFQVGHFGAISAHLGGEVEMLSEPFVLDGDLLTLLVFDFGGSATRVELRLVDGPGATPSATPTAAAADQPARVFRGANTKRLVPVSWNIAPLRGQRARLAIVDGHASRQIWTGVDEVYLIER
jgi:hypothetical protein